VESDQDISTDESDDEFLTPHQNVDVNAHQPTFKNFEPPMDLLICPPDDFDSAPPLPTPRQTPEQDDETPPQRPEDDDDTIEVIPRSAQPASVPTSSALTPVQPRQSRRVDKKGPAPRHNEVSADMTSELILPQRTRGKRKEAYALAAANIKINAGFHSAFAAGVSQAFRRQHQSTLSPEPKH
jgi:hypothetical protein